MKNNDRFRFRIWENRCKQFIYDGCINVRTGTFAAGNLLYEKYMIKEQCTGLKDKHEKLIYEGDIVLVEHKGKNRGYAKIQWDNDFAKFVIVFETHSYLMFDEAFAEDLKIIGNIHENPELLEK